MRVLHETGKQEKRTTASDGNPLSSALKQKLRIQSRKAHESYAQNRQNPWAPEIQSSTDMIMTFLGLVKVSA